MLSINGHVTAAVPTVGMSELMKRLSQVEGFEHLVDETTVVRQERLEFQLLGIPFSFEADVDDL